MIIDSSNRNSFIIRNKSKLLVAFVPQRLPSPRCLHHPLTPAMAPELALGELDTRALFLSAGTTRSYTSSIGLRVTVSRPVLEYS